MFRTGLVTLLLMGLGSTAMASDRVRVFITYDTGGYYGANHHHHRYRYRDCDDGLRWSTRDYGYRYDGYYDGYRDWRPYPSYGYWIGWRHGWSDGRWAWDHRDWRRRHGDHRGWDRRDGSDRDRDRDRHYRHH